MYDEWLGTQKPHRVICKEGHECNPRPTNVRAGQGMCVPCGYTHRVDPRQSQAEGKFRSLLKNMGAIPTYSSWKGIDEPHNLICREGHQVSVTPHGVNSGGGVCKICSGRDPIEAERKFREKLHELGAAPIYSTWQGANARHKVICVNGHACSTTWGYLQQGGKGVCIICSGLDPATAEQNFLRVLQQRGAIPAYGTWGGNKTKLEVLCSENHLCLVEPNKVTQGRNICTKCTGKGKESFTVFYVVRNPVTYVIKYGVTRGDAYARLSTHKYAGYTEQLYLRTGFEDAGRLEDAVDIALADAGYEPVQGLEYFRDDCLPYLLSLLPDVDS